MSRLYLDLETVPADDSITEENIRSAVPKNYSKKETIDNWIKNNKDNITKSIIKKRSLNPYECKIVCLSYAFDNEPVQALTGLEKEILRGFQVRLNEHLDKDRGGFVSGVEVIGHNIKGFDGPIMFIRAAKYKFDKLQQLFPVDRKRITDTMEMGCYYAYGNKVSLDTLCLFLGVPTPKKDMDGSKVYDAYKNGKIEEIAKYCNQDVEALREVHQLLSL